MEKINSKTTYMVNGKHRILGIFHDTTQKNTMNEYVVVWEHFDTNTIQIARTDDEGRAFGQGAILKPISHHMELEDLYDL